MVFLLFGVRMIGKGRDFGPSREWREVSGTVGPLSSIRPYNDSRVENVQSPLGAPQSGT